MLKRTRPQFVPLVLAFCALTALVTACGQKRPGSTGPQNVANTSQLLRLGKPYDCIRLEAELEQGINQDRASLSRLAPDLMKDSQRMLEEVLAQFSSHASCASAVPSYGKKLARQGSKALEDERTAKFYAHIHADILNSTMAAAEKIFGSGKYCKRADNAPELDPVSDLTIECVLPTERAKQYIAFVALDKTRKEPMLLTWRTSQAPSALRSATSAYALEVRANLWHSFKSKDGPTSIESDKNPSMVLRSQSAQDPEIQLDGSRPDGQAAFKKDVFAKLLPANCPR